MTAAPPLELVTIFTGSHERVVVLESLLAAEGIPSFVPDRMTKVWDPFITGGSPLALCLQVPTPHVAAARAIAVGFETPPAPPAVRSHRRRWVVVLLLILGPSALAALAMLASR
jgi:hypothetical protein